MPEGRAEAGAGDQRWRTLDARMRRFGHRRDALIETLHTVQDAFGHLDRDALAHVSAALREPLSRVYGVATFYSYFTLERPGDHTCVVCTGTACHLYGAGAILAALEREVGVAAGATSADGTLSVLTARCVGTCSLAPVVEVDSETAGRLSPGDVVARVTGLGR